MSSENAAKTSLAILQGPVKHKDPVCGMTVVPEKAAAQAAHEGKTYYFCSPGCVAKFEKEPQKYLAARDEAAQREAEQPSRSSTSRAATHEEKRRYTCRMHPHIAQPRP